MATRLERVEKIVGVPAGEVGRPLAIASRVERGLPPSAVDRIAKAVAPHDPAFKFRIVPKTTLDRRRKKKESLTSDESNRVARLAKVYAMASEVFGDQAKVEEFLRRPHMMLGGRIPRDVALATDPGADAVVNLLGRAAYSGGV